MCFFLFLFLDFLFIFVTLTQALSMMPASNVWLVLFFLMILLLSINVQVSPVLAPPTENTHAPTCWLRVCVVLTGQQNDFSGPINPSASLWSGPKLGCLVWHVDLWSLHSQLIHADSLATTIIDLFPQQLRRPHRRELLVLAMAVVCFLLGLPLITKVGTRPGSDAMNVGSVQRQFSRWIEGDVVLQRQICTCEPCAVTRRSC